MVSEAADRVIVMYCGQVVESASVEDLFLNPLHPYTEGLLNSIPVIDGEIDTLKAIKGSVPTPDNLPEGCRFAPRCSKAMDKCKTGQPELITHESRRSVRCFYMRKRVPNQNDSCRPRNDFRAERRKKYFPIRSGFFKGKSVI